MDAPSDTDAPSGAPEPSSEPERGSPPAPGTRKRALARASTVIGLAIAALAFSSVVRKVVADWDEVRSALADASVGWVALGFLCCVLAMGSIGWTWTDVMALLGSRVHRLRAIGWYFVGELGKYLPGGVWPVVGRGEMARKGGVPGAAAYASVGFSLITLYLAAMFAAVLTLPLAISGQGPGQAVLVLVLLPLGLAFLHPRVLHPLIGVARRLSGRPLTVPVPRWRDSVTVVARYLPTWTFIAGAMLALTVGIAPDEPLARVAFATLLSWVVGFVAVPAPGGAGIREAVFTATCGLRPEIGATIALLARVFFIIVDGGGAALAPALLRRAPTEVVEIEHPPL